MQNLSFGASDPSWGMQVSVAALQQGKQIARSNNSKDGKQRMGITIVTVINNSDCVLLSKSESCK